MYFPKDDFIGIDGVHHLAAGGETPFLKHHLAAVAQFATDKAGGMPGRERFFAARERVCTMLAQMLNVEATDVALLGSSSAGMIQVVSAYDWRSGDEVVTVDDEYPSGRYLFTWLARYGVTAVMPAYDPNPDNEVDAIVAAITPRTRLVYVSHVSTRTGRRIDLAPSAEALEPFAEVIWVPLAEQLAGLTVLPAICIGRFCATLLPRYTSAVATGPHMKLPSRNWAQFNKGRPDSLVVWGRSTAVLSSEASTRRPVEPVSTSTLSSVWQIWVPGLHTVTVAYSRLAR
jgi:hypothetical protein